MFCKEALNPDTVCIICSLTTLAAFDIDTLYSVGWKAGAYLAFAYLPCPHKALTPPVGGSNVKLAYVGVTL